MLTDSRDGSTFKEKATKWNCNCCKAQKKHGFDLSSQTKPSRLRFVEPALPRIQDSEPPYPPSGGDTVCNGLINTGNGGGMPGAWPEWSETEDEEQESGSEKFRATEQRRVVQTVGQPADG